MKITMIAIGSRGDVQPFIALGLGLARAGHQVRIATHALFEELVRERGLDFAPVAGDPRALQDTEIGQAMLHNTVSLWRGLRIVLGPIAVPAAADCLRACADADAIVTSTLAVFLAFNVAEKLRRPLVQAYPTPITPTRAYPVQAVPEWVRLGGSFNFLTHSILGLLMWKGFRPLVNVIRTEVLDLPPLPWLPKVEEEALHLPVLYGYSPLVAPPPPDWGDWNYVTGYWFLDQPADWQPPASLVTFLEQGPPPVFVGFGSLTLREAHKTTSMVLGALRRAGLRAVLQPGWGGMTEVEGQRDVLTIGSMPYDWLFPRMAAVVHHGGAGTTSAGLRAGVPSVLTPLFADQPYWGRRVAALGVGPRPIPLHKMTEARLADALRQATSDEAMRARAADLGRSIRAEDGIGRAVAAFERIMNGAS